MFVSTCYNSMTNNFDPADITDITNQTTDTAPIPQNNPTEDEDFGYLFLTTNTPSLAPRWTKTHYFCLAATKERFHNGTPFCNQSTDIINPASTMQLLWQTRDMAYEDTFSQMCEAMNECSVGDQDVQLDYSQMQMSAIIGQWFYCSFDYIMKIYDRIRSTRETDPSVTDIESWLL